MKQISISSGFQQGGSLLEWDGSKFTLVRAAHENTWSDDGDSSFSVGIDDGFRGAVVRFHGVSSLSYVSEVELIGFTAEELDGPSPVTGWYSKSTGCRCDESFRVETLEEYLKALALGIRIETDAECVARGRKSPSGQVLVELDFQWGDQSAAGWAVYSSDAHLIETRFGCGDRTPEPRIDGDGKWEFETASERTHAAWREEQEAWDAALSRADGEIARHLEFSYRIGSNPLPTLRKRYGGKWTYYAGGHIPVGIKSVLYLSTDKDTGDLRWAVVNEPSE